jgi:retinol dehydrogenase-12
MFSNEFARRYGAEGIVSTSLHPGIIKTDLTRHLGLSSLMQRFGNVFSYDVSYGAITSLYAGTAPAAGELNGKVGTPSVWGSPLTSDHLF